MISPDGGRLFCGHILRRERTAMDRVTGKTKHQAHNYCLCSTSREYGIQGWWPIGSFFALFGYCIGFKENAP